MKNFRYGAVIKVQREHTEEKIFSAMDKMKAIGMNTVVIWPAVYWWEDKNSPNYPFGTGHAILRHAEEIGMKVVMELAGQIPCLEYAPDFKMKEEYFAIGEEGGKNFAGTVYGYYNYNHPGMKDLIVQCYRDVAQNYKGYSSLFGYDIWNETVFTSFDSYTLQLFRDWLRDKYGSIEKLNDSWDRSYTDWSQVEFARWLWASVMPKVDYEEFHKDNIGMILTYMRDAVKSVDDIHPVIADNIFSMITLPLGYGRGQDDWTVAANTDIYGMDMYPKIMQIEFPEFFRWQTFTGASSATANGAFWVSELQTHHTTMFDAGAYVFPQELRLWCWEAISHGAKGLIYWKWEPFNKGIQTYGRGLVDFKGEYTPRALEAGAVAKVVAQHEEEFLSYMPEQPKAAVLFDRLSYDFVQTLAPGFGVSPVGKESPHFYNESMAGLYKCLWEQNIPAKFITDRDLTENLADSYSVIFVSNHVNISPEISDALVRYMEQGGTVVADGKFGEIGDTGLVYEQIPGAGLHAAAGFEITDMRPDNLGMTFREPVSAEKLHIEGFYERRELLVGEGPDVWADYGDGRPAVVCTKIGRGELIYVSTLLWHGYLKNAQSSSGARDFVSLLDRRYTLRTFAISDDALKVAVLRGTDGLLAFAFNYTAGDLDAEITLRVGQDGEYRITELYSGETVTENAADGALVTGLHATAQNVSIYLVKHCGDTGATAHAG